MADLRRGHGLTKLVQMHFVLSPLRLSLAISLLSSAHLFAAVPSPGAPEASPSPSPVPTPVVFAEDTLAELKQIQQAALNSDYAYRQVKHLSNNIGPRLSGSAQAEQAVQYVADEMKALGADVLLEKTLVPHWVRGEEKAELLTFPGQAPNTTQKIVLTALGGSVATPPEGITAEVVSVKNFDELKALSNQQVKGRIVLFNYPFDKQMAAEGRGGEAYSEAVAYRAGGPSAAARLGAVACLIRSVGGADYRLPHTGATNYASDAPRIPAAAVTAEDAELVSALRAEGPVTMRLVLTPQILPDAESANVIADLKGSEHPEQVIVVSGHLDSWDLGTGAIDDGAGVAVSMQAAHLLQQLHLRPKRTIRVIAWMNEENGTAGSKSYARENKGQLGNHFAAIETDGGAGHPIGINIHAKKEVKAMLLPIATVLQSSGAGGLNASDHAGADISPLEEAGVPSFAPIQDSRFYFNYHHTAADTLDKVDPRELQENAAVVAVLAYGLANMQPSLPR